MLVFIYATSVFMLVTYCYVSLHNMLVFILYFELIFTLCICYIGIYLVFTYGILYYLVFILSMKILTISVRGYLDDSVVITVEAA